MTCIRISLIIDHTLLGIGDDSGHITILDSALDCSFSQSILKFKTHDNAVFDLAFSDQDATLATASGDRTAAVWDMKTRQCLAVLPGQEAYSGSIKQVCFGPTSNGKVIATCSRDGSLNMWDLRCTGTKTGNIVHHKPIVNITKAHDDAKVPSRKQNVHVPGITAIAYLPQNDKLLLSACDANGIIKLWDMRKAISPYRNNARPVEKSPMLGKVATRPFGITSLAVGNGTVYAVSKDNWVYALDGYRLSDGAYGAVTHPKLRGHSFYIKASLSREGEMLACGSSNECVLVFPTSHIKKGGYSSDGIGRALEGGHDQEVTGLSWSYEGYLATLSDDRTCRLWSSALTPRNSNNNNKKKMDR